MPTLHIEHPITDYATWKAAFDRFEAARTNAGVQGAHIQQPVDDDRYIVLDLAFGTVEQAQGFLSFLEANVWSSPATSPGLAGSPRTAILETV